MTIVIRKCVKCGCEFQSGIFPQSTCDMCSECGGWNLEVQDET